MLGTGDWATPIVVSPDAAGHVTLSLIDHRGLEVDGQRLRLRASAATPFVPEPVSPMANHLYLRTRDGLYLTAPTPGEPFLLAAQPGPGSHARLRPTALVRPLWGADPGQWNNENRSTHLWIFNRAVELIRATPRLAPGQLELLRYLDDATFVKSVKQG